MDAAQIAEMDELIQRMRQCAEELKKKDDGIQAVERNVDRILANIKMLELNISDLKDLI
jgi:predicted component of type VI protein secretion system